MPYSTILFKSLTRALSLKSFSSFFLNAEEIIHCICDKTLASVKKHLTEKDNWKTEKYVVFDNDIPKL